MHAFNQSLQYDKRMYAADIQGSIAYTKALTMKGILTESEKAKMIDGLMSVLREWNKARQVCQRSRKLYLTFSMLPQFQIQADDEDIHTANERRLSEIVGPLGGKLHTGRSRNDQVATDMRLWLLAQIKDLEKHLSDLISVMAERALSEKDILLPGYTHLQVRVACLVVAALIVERAESSPYPLVTSIAVSRVFLSLRSTAVATAGT